MNEMIAIVVVRGIDEQRGREPTFNRWTERIIRPNLDVILVSYLCLIASSGRKDGPNLTAAYHAKPVTSDGVVSDTFSLILFCLFELCDRGMRDFRV